MGSIDDLEPRNDLWPIRVADIDRSVGRDVGHWLGSEFHGLTLPVDSPTSFIRWRHAFFLLVQAWQ